MEIDKKLLQNPRQYIKCFNATYLLKTFLIFHLVNFLLSNRLQYPHQALYTSHQLSSPPCLPLSTLWPPPYPAYRTLTWQTPCTSPSCYPRTSPPAWSCASWHGGLPSSSPGSCLKQHNEECSVCRWRQATWKLGGTWYSGWAEQQVYKGDSGKPSVHPFTSLCMSLKLYTLFMGLTLSIQCSNLVRMPQFSKF